MTKKYLRHRFKYEGREYAVYAHTQKELIEKVAKKKRDLRVNKTHQEYMSVVAWREVWLDTYKANKVAPRTLSTYRTILNHLELTIPIKDVRPVDLQNAINSLAGNSQSMIHKFAVLTRAMFEAAVDNGLCVNNPAKNLDIPAGYTRPRRPLTCAERGLIEKVIPESRAGSYVALMLYAGCRPGEAGIVQGKDIDKGAMLLHIRGTKTPSADRYVPITNRLLPFIENLEPEEWAVKNYRGGPSTRDSRRGLWREFVRELNIAAGAKMGRPSKHTPWDVPLENLIADDLQPYLLRHTFCTDLEAAGVPINIARDLMGHSSIAITSKVYTHRTEASLGIAKKLMENI